jgi:transposase-like protein
VAEVQFEATLIEIAPRPTYQRIALKARHLSDLGLSHSAIARRLGVSDKTTAKAIELIHRSV